MFPNWRTSHVVSASFNKDDDKDTLVYAILDKGAEDEGKAHPLGAKRHRTRISRPETDHVYSVNGKDGENLDTPKAKKSAAKSAKLFKDVQKLLRPIQKTKTTIKK